MENRDEWDRMLTEPIPGARPKRPTQQELESEGADFMNFMGAMTG